MSLTKKIFLSLISIISLVAFVFVSTAEAYVNVRGYTRKDGTYVQPHVRSNPNGLKYDNYSYKPSQGLYNPSYGTRGSTWDTPTYITDPNYYTGKYLYETGQSGVGGSSSYTSPLSKPKTQSTVQVPANASLNYFGTGWSCNSGYKRVGDQCGKIAIPQNASLNYFGNDWVCNKGHRRIGQSCEAVIIPQNASLNYYGNDWVCNSGFRRVGSQCDKVIIPANAKLNYYGNDWVCNSGYKRVGNQCESLNCGNNEVVSYYGNSCVCKTGYYHSYVSGQCAPL